MDNEASLAGMEELRGHIGVLTARMKQLCQGGNESKAADVVLDDISDYYERAVQLRTYRITSLEEELKTQTQKAEEVKKSAARGWWAARICLFFAILILVEVFNPGVLKDFFANPSTLSHGGVAIGSILGFRVLFRNTSV